MNRGSIRRRLLGLVILAAMLASLAALPGAASAQQSDPYGGTFTFGLVDSPDTLNPYSTILSITYTILHHVYETLVDYDENFNYVPALATEFEVSPDGMIYTFKLSGKARWHDGQPLTSEDVKFTIEMIKEFELGTFAAYVDAIAKVETPDPQTVIVTMSEPLATQLSNFRSLYIVPKHIWSQFKSSEEILEFPNQPIIGSGPFQFVEYNQDQYVRLAANTEYWKGRPYVDQFIIRWYQNGEAAVQALKAGEVDAIEDVPGNLLPTLQQDPNISTLTAKSFWFHEVIINSLKGSKGNPLLLDPAIRQAMAHATDKEFIVKTVMQGQGVPGLAVISPANTEWFNSEIKNYEFDLDKARQILEAAGYIDRDGDGVRESKDGQKLEFRFNVVNEAQSFRAGQLLSEWWKQVGIIANPEATEDLSSLVYADDDEDGVVDHNFDLLIWSWSGEPDPDFNLWTMTTGQIGEWQDAGYSNPEYDELYEAQRREMDPAKRRQMVWRMQELLMRDIPYIVLWSPIRVQAYRSDRWTNVVEMVDGIVSRLNTKTAVSVRKVVQETASSEAPAGSGSGSAATGGSGEARSGNTLLWVIIGGVVVLALGAVVLRRRRDGDEE